MGDSKRRAQGSDLPEGWRPLSDAPVTELVGPDGKLIRVDAVGRLLCHARRRDGELCKAAVTTGMKVCRMHGGSTQRAKNGARLRLAELINPAIATLAREMTNADKSVDRQRAANSILDRGGLGRHAKIEMQDAKELLYQRMLAMTEEAEGDEPDAEDMDFETLPAAAQIDPSYKPDPEPEPGDEAEDDDDDDLLDDDE